MSDHSGPKPDWQIDDGSVKLYCGDVVDVLERLPPKSVHCVVTSPPYWGLRDYGTGTWEGGNEHCDHSNPPEPKVYLDRNGKPGRNNTNWDNRHGLKRTCSKCGAKRIDQQLGSEPSPDCGTNGQAQCGKCFVCAMVKVFRGVYRVLRDDGTLWLNLGDCYSSGGRGGGAEGLKGDKQRSNYGSLLGPKITPGFKPGNLIGAPWRVALALQADGWILRQDIIWAKPSPMPESVRNRCTKAHEYIFLLTKRGSGYFYDQEAVKEKSGRGGEPGYYAATNRGSRAESAGRKPSGNEKAENRTKAIVSSKANKRSVWTVASEAFPGAHFATFPKKLITPCILAGTSEKGCCGECGAPWKRVVSETKLKRERPNDYVKRTGEDGTGNSCANSVAGVSSKTIGWQPGCDCDADTVPCVVLDPFTGSGTTGLVSQNFGRAFWGIELSNEYFEMSKTRLDENADIAAKKLEAERIGITVQELENGQGTLWQLGDQAGLFE